MFFCQISKIFKNIFFKEHLRWLLLYILYTHDVTCNRSRWNNGYNGNYKKDEKKLKHFENTVFWNKFYIIFHFLSLCIYNNTQYRPDYSFSEGNMTKYFELQKGARQDDPISTYLFILCLEIVFILIKANKRVKRINTFKHTLLYSAYADDTTFFLRDRGLLKSFFIHLLHF